MYDYLIINDEIEQALQDLVTVMNAERLRLAQNDEFWTHFFADPP
jgi:guanylate kinase